MLPGQQDTNQPDVQPSHESQQPAVSENLFNKPIPPSLGISPQPIKSHPKKGLVIVICIAALIVVAGIILVLFLLSGTKHAPSPIHVKQPLLLQTNSTPVKYNDRAVIQACNIITQSDLDKLGYTIDPISGPGAFYRTYFTGEDTPNITFGAYGDLQGPDGPYTNSCRYSLSHSVSVMVAVFQSSYIASGSFENYLEGNQAQSQPDVDGMKVATFTDQDTNDLNYAITSRDGKTDVVFYIESSKHDSHPTDITKLQNSLLHATTKNLGSQSSTPTGSPKLIYTTKAFPATYLRACDIVSNSDFKAMYNNGCKSSLY